MQSNTRLPKPTRTKRALLAYLRLEETDETVDLLTTSSLIYLGFYEDGPSAHYWSYPTEDGVAWLSLSLDDAVSAEADVPDSIKTHTPDRSAHPMKRIAPTGADAPDRRPRGVAVWVPQNQHPLLDCYPVYTCEASFDRAIRLFKARPTSTRYAGDVEKEICLHLRTGRYAILNWRESRPTSILIFLELQPRSSDRYVGGAHVEDIHEVCGYLEVPFEKPEPRHWSIEWR